MGMPGGTGGVTCALAVGGAAYCWGYNDFALVGDGSLTYRSLPTAVQGKRTFIQVVLGEGTACGLVPDGTAYCWGDDHDGWLGSAAPPPDASCTRRRR